jgi:hypothetical protein
MCPESAESAPGSQGNALWRHHDGLRDQTCYRAILGTNVGVRGAPRGDARREGAV